MKALTIKDLYKECEKQMRLGNGDKVIMISSDDEGNGYHYLWYPFTTIEEMEEPVKLGDKIYKETFNYTSDNVAKKENTIILG